MDRAAEILAHAKEYLQRGVGYVETLHCGPLDWNVTQAADQLRTAAANLEMYLEEVERGDVSQRFEATLQPLNTQVADD